MVILMLMSGSMGSMSMMAGSTMPAVVWFRRFMIVATFLTAGYSIYRLIHHNCRDKRIIGFTIVSALVSIGFVLYTLIDFGW